MPALEAFRAAVGRLAAETGAEAARESLDRVLGILLEGFDPGWLERNQKFDFSISASGGRGAALSVNDFGEKDAFDAKILRVFELFAPAFDAAAAERMLEAARPLKALHQTTIGLDWPGGARAPRLKVYLEELRHRYPASAREGLLRRVCAAVGAPPLGLPFGEDLAALCVDFFPGGRVAVKTYAYRERGGEAPGFEPFVRALSSEPRCFFYRTVRYGAAGGIESEKMYKVYEARQIADWGAGFSEIGGAFSAEGGADAAGRIEGYRALVRGDGASLYPVLCALDRPAVGRPRLDAYFSIR